MMKKLAVAAALLAAFTGTAQAGKTLDTIKQRDQLVCGVNPSLPGFSAADSQGNWTGLDVDICKAIAAIDSRRRQEGQVGAAQRVAALHRAAVGRDRHPLAQHDVDADARRVARPRIHRRHLLRRTGLHGAEEVEDHERQAAQGRDRLRAVGHDDREEPVRFLEGQQPRDEARRLRDAGGDQQGVLLGTLPGLHDGRLRASPRCATRKRAIPKTT